MCLAAAAAATTVAEKLLQSYSGLQLSVRRTASYSRKR